MPIKLIGFNRNKKARNKETINIKMKILYLILSTPRQRHLLRQMALHNIAPEDYWLWRLAKPWQYFAAAMLMILSVIIMVAAVIAAFVKFDKILSLFF